MTNENLENKAEIKDAFLKIESQEISERVISGLLGAVAGAGLYGGFAYLLARGITENPMKAAYITGSIAAVFCGLYLFGGSSWDAEDDGIREKYDNLRKKCVEDMEKNKNEGEFLGFHSN